MQLILILEIPRPKLEYAYYKVPGKKYNQGNWLQVSRSYGNYSEIISRNFEYRSAMSDVIKSEFATIDKDRQGIKTKHEQRAAAAVE